MNISFKNILTLAMCMALLSPCSSFCFESNESSVGKTRKNVTYSKFFQDKATIKFKVRSKNYKYVKTYVKYPVFSNLNDKKFEKSLNGVFRKAATGRAIEFERDAKSAYDEAKADKYKFRKYELSNKFKVKRNNGGILSIINEHSRYTGGAHGFDNIIAYNYDLNACKKLTLKSYLSQKNANYKSIINAEISKQMNAIEAEEKKMLVKNGESLEFYIPRFSENFTGINKGTHFYVTSKQIVIFYESDEITDPGYGIPKFPVPLSMLTSVD